jgi:hypothetical protein
MRNIVESAMLIRRSVRLPGDFELVTEEFGEGWSFVQSGSTRVASNIYWGVESLDFCSALFASSLAFIFVSRL